MRGARRPGPDQISVLNYSGCNEVLRCSDLFSSHWYERGLTLFVGPTILGMDEPEHSRIRILLEKAFAKNAMTWWMDDLIRPPAVDDELHALLPRGRADLYDRVAARVPVQTIVSGLGLSPGDRTRFFERAVEMTGSGPPQDRLRPAARSASSSRPSSRAAAAPRDKT